MWARGKQCTVVTCFTYQPPELPFWVVLIALCARCTSSGVDTRGTEWHNSDRSCLICFLAKDHFDITGPMLTALHVLMQFHHETVCLHNVVHKGSLSSRPCTTSDVRKISQNNVSMCYSSSKIITSKVLSVPLTFSK